MYFLSEPQRKEFLATPELIRLVIPDNVETPSLLIKASTLTLKYFYSLRKFSLIFKFLPSYALLCCVMIEDDPGHPGAVWSLASEENELRALKALAQGEDLDIFLFNEVAINVASASGRVMAHGLSGWTWFPAVFLSPLETDLQSEEVGKHIDAMRSLDDPGVLRFQLEEQLEWRKIKSHYVSNSLRPSMLSLEENEGDQQEELAVWLTDALHFQGAVKQPQVPDGLRTRELCDVLLAYLGGSFLIESKTLSVLDRGVLPDRNKLKKNSRKNVAKALDQLAGACRSLLKLKLAVTTLAGDPIEIPRDILPHCIVLVPDVTLFDEEDNLGGPRIEQFFAEQSAYLHIMDPIGLLRSVQHALVYATLSESGLPEIMTFDAALIKRWEFSKTINTPNFALLMRQEHDLHNE